MPCGRTLVAADTAEIGEYATSYNRVRLPKRRAAELNLLGHLPVMATMDVFGFAREDLIAARKVLEAETALSISFGGGRGEDGSGSYFR